MTASERLRRNTKKVMRCWEQRARKEIVATRHQESLALQNTLPEFLEVVADALSTTIDRTDGRKRADRIESLRVGKLHGRERAASLNYTLDQMIFEYHILRQAIFDVLEEDSALSPREREVIVGAIEQAVNDASTEFTEVLRAIQEKFTHTMAHDLRGHITTAKTGAQLILRRPDDAEHCAKIASRIVSNMDKMDAMIQDLLDVSRFRAGEELPLHLEKNDLDLIARQVADEAIFSYGNRFVVKSEGPCWGDWDERGLERSIMNLITNAVKFGLPDTPITISVSQNRDIAKVAVHNEGPPIPPEEQSVLFQQFRRSHAAKSKMGWGLGLTIVEGMAQAHHGRVYVESEAGKGTTFTMELPKNEKLRKVA